MKASAAVVVVCEMRALEGAACARKVSVAEVYETKAWVVGGVDEKTASVLAASVSQRSKVPQGEAEDCRSEHRETKA